MGTTSAQFGPESLEFEGAKAVSCQRMSKKTRLSPALIILSAALVLMALSRVFSPSVNSDRPRVGETAPKLAGVPVEGTIPESTNRVVLLDFWASWCGPCEMTFPLIEDLHRRYSARGLVVIGVSVDREKEDMDRFLKRHRVSFANVRDTFSHLSEAYNANALPKTFVIGADGKIVGVHIGFNPAAGAKEYADEIETALKAAGR
jgi:cytochrome c biogenesis protein CcmG, thiol:disulfide interchange protein DsbE